MDIGHHPVSERPSDLVPLAIVIAYPRTARLSQYATRKRLLVEVGQQYLTIRYFDLRPLDYLTAELSVLWWFFLLQGFALILLGIAVIIFPQLLAILAAAFFIAIGIVLLTFAWRVRRVKQGYEHIKRQILEG